MPAGRELASPTPASATNDPAPHLVMPVVVSTSATPTQRSVSLTRTVPISSPVADATDLPYDLVLVGGVPGAGKTTAIARATDDLDHVAAVDPEHVAWWLRRHLPSWVPYRAYRWLVHLLHTIRVLIHLLDGPVSGRRLVVHDPGTRARRRSVFLLLAHLAGWQAVLLYVDVDRPAAQDGQVRRGRVVRSFDEHWQNWQRLRPALVAGAATAADANLEMSAEPVLLVDRTEAADVLRRLCLTA
jgi:hypothetical protein